MGWLWDRITARTVHPLTMWLVFGGGIMMGGGAVGLGGCVLLLALAADLTINPR